MNRAGIIGALFIINSCSLIFEVVASRKAATYLGATAYANSALLAAFLAGIGLGGWAAGTRTSDPARATRRCAFLLLVASVFCIVLPMALTWLTAEGPSFLPARAFMTVLLVLPVGFAVGHSYPALTALHGAAGALGPSVAGTYAADTLGAASGALMAGLVLVPKLGLQTSAMIAGTGLAFNAAALFASRPPSNTTHASRTVPPPAPASAKASHVLTVFLVTGFAALALEVAWIRLFTLVIGTSIFSFSLTVAAFLAALGLGSQLMRGRVDQIKAPSNALCLVLTLIGITSTALLLLTPVWERIYLAAYQASTSVLAFQLMVFGLGLMSIAVPAGLMGAGFSLGARLLHAGGPSAARSVGRLYGINTLGGVLGALAAGLVLLPTLGVRGTVLICSVLYILCGVGLSFASGPKPKASLRLGSAIGGATVLLVSLLPEPRMFFAPYYHGLRIGSYAEFSRARNAETLLYHRFSPYGLVTVSADANGRYLRHNGRSEASTSPLDMSTQLLIAHLPLLMHPNPQRVLNIGLGAGFTLGAITQHREVASIVQAELDGRVVEAALLHFSDVTGNALADPRVTTHVTDGRRLLAADSALYDVIISEPSHLWVSGVSGLFTTEFYRIVNTRLAKGGSFATWIPHYEMSPEDIQIVAATLLDEFAHVTAFENGSSDIILIASNSPLSPTSERVAAGLEQAGIERDFRRAMQGFPLNVENLTNLLSQVAANADAMARAIPPGTPLNTDDWPVLEFHTALAAVSKRAPVAVQSP